MKPLISVIIALLLSVCFFNAYSQGTSNKGTEFWTTYADHIRGATGAANSSKMSLYITSDVSTQGSVAFIDGTPSVPFIVTANQVTVVDIPANQFLGSSYGKFNKGIHIVSDKPIAIYAHIYANSVSGATLLFPVSAMGKTYVSLNYTQISNSLVQGGEGIPSYSFFTVIGTENNTTVEITPSASLTDGTASGTTISITLQKGEVYKGLSLNDLTGTKIRSISNAAGDCKKIAVFSGSTKIGIGCGGNGTSDNLFQQVYPTSAWGKNYVTAPLKSRPFDIYRIILSDPTTNVFLNGTQINSNQFTSNYHEFTSSSTNVISADKPIQVVQYAVTQGCSTNNSDRGDPEMIYLTPIEQGLDQVTLYSMGYHEILQSYINVVIPTSAVSSFTLDGQSYASSFLPINSTYSYAQIDVSSGLTNSGKGSVTSGTHTIKASERFNAIAYGFGSVESYGYAAGTNLQDLNRYVRLKNTVSNNVQTTGCAGIDYDLQLTLPYATASITWKIDSNAPVTIVNPTYIMDATSGQTLYIYNYSAKVNFPPGSHKVIATVIDPNDECGATANIEYNFEITGLPTVDFTAPANTCLGDATEFEDTSVPPVGTTIKSWSWDFGDGLTSTLQNPTHTYAAASDYTVALTITDANGCTTISTATIHVAQLPVANFSVSTPNCEGQNIAFTDGSSSTDGVINKWVWDYGDGSPVDPYDNGVPVIKHTYATAGSYDVVLWVTTDKGCTSFIKNTIVVNPAPVVDFTLPEICLADAFAQFTDKTTISSGSITSYLWDFGDAVNSTTLNPNTSTLKNPRHKYVNTGVYTATLTVTSSSGCVSVKSQQFVVNGSRPQAAFSYPTNICSSDNVVFTDQSTVDVGNIIREVWYFDYGNNPAVSETFTTANMPANKMYYHQYPLSNSTKKYLVRIEVYSGQSCSSVVEHEITVNANPIVTLTPAIGLTLCQYDVPVQIVENTNGFIGTGAFSGPGISSTGLFNPKISGVGTFTINYLFTTSNTGCTYATTMQITVNPTPEITLVSNLQFLEGGQLKIDPIVKISSGTVTYKWSPSTGLDHDDILNPIANPTDDITYTLTVTSDKFCSAVARVAVTVLKAPLVNNTFTPNGDGINDTWNIKYLESYPKATVAIFNRLGERLYYSIGYPIAWDGRYKGADLPTGVYYYIINPNTPGRKTYSGYVTIIR